MIISKTCYCLKNMKFTLHFQNILNITNFCDVLHFPSNFLSSSRISFTFPQNVSDLANSLGTRALTLTY
jgi:hypothetical protein